MHSDEQARAAGTRLTARGGPPRAPAARCSMLRARARWRGFLGLITSSSIILYCYTCERASGARAGGGGGGTCLRDALTNTHTRPRTRKCGCIPSTSRTWSTTDTQPLPARAQTAVRQRKCGVSRVWPAGDARETRRGKRKCGVHAAHGAGPWEGPRVQAGCQSGAPTLACARTRTHASSKARQLACSAHASGHKLVWHG